MKRIASLIALPFFFIATAVAAPVPLRDKTLVVWVAPANLTQQAGSALTIDDGQSHFDGIIFGEITPKKWMPGSDGFCRTLKEQGNWPDETADGRTFVQVAIAYKDRQVTVYRNGQQHAHYTMGNPPQEFGPQSAVVIGMRHLDQGDDAHFAGAIDDARIYDRALSAEQVTALKPNEASEPMPWAWWTFDDKAAEDRTGRFKAVKLAGGAKVEDGKLVLDGMNASLFATVSAADSFHFRASVGNMGDTIPFYHNGQYHVFYLTWGAGKTSWDHIVSTDLVHWKELPRALISDGAADGPDGENMFTGCVIEKDGVFHLYYTGWNPRNPQGREWVMHATSTDLVKWTKHPEHGFRADGVEYLNRDFRDPYVFWNDKDKAWWMLLCTTAAKTDVAVVGLLRSEDLIHWQQLSPLVFDPPLPVGETGTPECPDLFRIGDYWYLLYTRHVQNIRRSKDILGPYRPCEPSALDGSILLCGKRMLDGKRHTYVGPVGGGPYSVMCLPRELYAGPEGQLYQRPVGEVTAVFTENLLQFGEPRDVAAGFVLQTPDNYMLQCSVRIDPQATLVINMREQSGPSGGYTLNLRPKSQEADLNGPGFRDNRRCTLDTSKPIKFQAFVQGSIIECFINDQFAYTCRAHKYPKGVLSFKVEGGKAEVLELKVKARPRLTPYRPANGLVGATAAPVPLQDKTLVAWVSPANLTQQGGSVLTLEDQQDHFDGIVFGELSPARWMAGSDGFNRTQKDQSNYPAEMADPGTLGQMAIVYRGSQVTVYRNGKEYARHAVARPQSFGADSAVVLGLRHLNAGGAACFAGTIEDARIYDFALSTEQLAALKPDQPSDPKPWAWWTFENGKAEDLMKAFPVVEWAGNARVENGWLLLDGQESYAVFRKIAAPRVLPKQEPGLYHPAGMSMWDTWYLQRGNETHVFHLQLRRDNARRAADHESIGHAVSTDLIHWKELPVALRKGPKGSYDDSWALFTGCAVEHGNTVYLFYCGNHQPADRCRQSMCLATSPSHDGVKFTRYEGNPIIEPDPQRYYSIHEPPAPFKFHAWPHIDCRDLAVVKDPAGDGWLGYVMMRRKGQTDAFHSACIALSRSKDLVHWKVGEPCCTPNRFNCFEVPDVFKLGDKWYLIALTGDAYGQSTRWSDPNITCATVVFQADRPEGPFEEVKENLLLASTGQQGYSARTVERKGERLMFYTRPSEPYARLAWPVKLAPRAEGGLHPMYWPGLDKAFGPAQSQPPAELNAGRDRALHPLPGLSAKDSAFMITATVELKGARSAGFAFGQAPRDSHGSPHERPPSPLALPGNPSTPVNGYSIIIAINVGRIHNSRAAVVVDSADSLSVRAEKRPNQSAAESRDQCHLHSRR